MAKTRKVLVVTLEPIAKQMAGPAIRAYEIAKQLAREFDVSLFSPYESNLENPQGMQLYSGLSKQAFYKLCLSQDIFFIQANVLKPYPRLAKMGKYLAVDLYDPYLLSLLAQYSADTRAVSASYRLMHKVLEAHMTALDFAVCASERQRDYYLGRFCSLGRMTPETYKIDPSFRKLIDVVPFGMPAKPPSRTACGIKGSVAGIAPEDKVLIWGGGIWEWFDPLTVIKATAQVAKLHPEIKLYFMGVKSPNPQVPLMDMVGKAKALAESLGVLNKTVFFGPSWVGYEERANYLLDADIAVSAHFDLPETRFSFRTRILDYLWAGLPILTTGGDQFADLIESHLAGMALGEGDVGAWAQAIEQLAFDPMLAKTYRQGAAALAGEFTWEKAVLPLLNFCTNPHKLPKYAKITMPSLSERAQAVYERGGKELLISRSKQLFKDLLRG